MSASTSGQNQSNQKTNFLGKRVAAGDIQCATLTAGSRGTPGYLAWTPTLVNFTLGTGSGINGRYSVVGKTVHFTLVLFQTGAGSVTSGDAIVTLPVPARTNSPGVMAHGTLLVGSNRFFVTAVRETASRISFFALSNSAGPTKISDASNGADSNATWELSINGTYEID